MLEADEENEALDYRGYKYRGNNQGNIIFCLQTIKRTKARTVQGTTSNPGHRMIRKNDNSTKFLWMIFRLRNKYWGQLFTLVTKTGDHRSKQKENNFAIN